MVVEWIFDRMIREINLGESGLHFLMFTKRKFSYKKNYSEEKIFVNDEGLLHNDVGCARKHKSRNIAFWYWNGRYIE